MPITISAVTRTQIITQRTIKSVPTDLVCVPSFSVSVDGFVSAVSLFCVCVGSDTDSLSEPGAVSVCSSVCVAWPDGRETVYHILGEWDQIPEKNFISVTTPVGQLLNGKSVGDTVEMPNGDAPDAPCTVKSISPLSQEILDWVK